MYVMKEQERRVRSCLFFPFLPLKVHLVKAMIFPVVMYGCESWTVKRLSTEELMLLNCSVGEDS